jgi:hypothetical protein
MKLFDEKAQPKQTEYVPTQHDLERQKEIDEYLQPEDRKQLLFRYAGRILRDANNDIQSVLDGHQLAKFNSGQQEEIIQNMRSILDEKQRFYFNKA